MFDGFGAFGLVFKLMSFVGVLIPVLVFFFVFRRISSFKNNVFQKIGPEVFQAIAQAPNANRTYVKTKCDHCGARCTGNKDISPTGDTKCSYCDAHFNVLRS